MTRPLVIPTVLVMAPLALGCSDAPAPDAAADASAVVDVGDAADATLEAALDAAMDATLDAPEAVEEVGVDIQFSERRVDVSPPDGAMCTFGRNDAGAIVCREEGLPVGSGFLCLRYLCDADDGGSSTDGCCRLVS
ncbi:MAG: hypothetical protein U0324_45005 [Polyangiales bacterium]